MFGNKRLKQPENIVHDLHLPITPRPCADTNSRYLQALTDQCRELCWHEFEYYGIRPSIFDRAGIVYKTGSRRLRSALDTPSAELMDALGRQTNMGHHGDTILHQAVDGWCYMPAPFQLDGLGPRLLEKARSVGQSLIGRNVVGHERQIANDKGALRTAYH